MQNNNNQSENTDIRGEKMPRLIKYMLNPTEQVYDKCSPHTKTNLFNLSNVLAFTGTISGAVLGSSITTFCFSGEPWTFALTIPAGIFLYVILDRLVVMADAKKYASFIKVSRITVAFLFALYNSMLIDTMFYKPDIEAERTKETTIAQASVQHDINNEKEAVQLHKESMHAKIKELQAPLQARSNELIKEVAGAGISGNVGKGVVYQVTKDAFDRDSIEVARQVGLLLAEARNDDSTLARLDREAIQKKKDVPAQISTGALHTLDLLHTVVMQKPFNMFVAALFFLMCMILELLPLLAKYYIDITEYSLHGTGLVEAHLDLREIDKQHTIERERHHRKLRHKHRMQELSFTFSLEALKQKTAHSENILSITNQHFATVVPIEEEMRISYPDQFNQHIAPVFANIYSAFHKSQNTAFQTELSLVHNN